MISLMVRVGLPLFASAHGEVSSCNGKECPLDGDQFAMLQANQLWKPTCASEGQDVYWQNHYAGSTPVTCCDGQAAQNCDGKMLCPLGGGHYGKAICPGKAPAGKPTCANEGLDVYEQNTYAGSTPVTCCDGQAAQNCDGKMLCPLGGEHWGKAICPGKAPAGKPTCANAGQDVYDDYTFASTPVTCCDGQNTVNTNGKILCPDAKKEVSGLCWAMKDGYFECHKWLAEGSCSTTFADFCPGMDHPLGNQYKYTPVSAACPAQCR